MSILNRMVLSGKEGFFRRLAASILLLNFIIIGLVIFSLYISFNNHLQRIVTSAQNLSATLAQSVNSTIDKADLGLRTAVDRIEHRQATGGSGNGELTTFMTRLKWRLPWVISLRSTDEHGITKYGSDITKDIKIDLSDRLYFIGQRDNPDVGLFINKPVVSSIDKAWVISLARRINHPDGRFAGVVYANIALDNLTPLFSSLSLGINGVINLRDYEQEVIMSYPAPDNIDSNIGQKVIAPAYRRLLEAGHRSGTYHELSPFNPDSRIFSFHRTASHPLFITVSLTGNEVLSHWWNEALMLSALVLLFILISLSGLWVTKRSWNQQLQTTRKLTSEVIERKKTELQLKQASEFAEGVINAIPDILFEVDEKGRYTNIWTGQEDQLMAPKEVLIGKTVHEVLSPKDAALSMDSIREANEKGASTGNIIQLDLPQGSHWFELSVAKKSLNEGSCSEPRFLVLSRDVTERMHLEKELRHHKENLEQQVQQRTDELIVARDAAEAANRAKNAFLANISHELRTPLNTILGFTSLMLKDPMMTETKQKQIDIITRSGEHLLTLINDALQMAKIVDGQVKLHAEPFDLGAMLRAVMDKMQPQAQENDLQLMLDQSANFPRYIVGDESRLQQILVNLLSNAIKYTPQGTVTLRLDTDKNTPPRLLIEVEDSGIGITPEDQELIFEPFVQLGEQNIHVGTGIGLTITRKLVHMMKGSISVRSSPGNGSLFSVHLPLQKALEADINSSKQPLKDEAVTVASGHSKYRILIVEDQRDNQLLLERLMKNIGLQTKIANDGEECINLFYTWHPDLIWMDQRMPGIDGSETTRRIRKLPGGDKVKIVAVTADAMEEHQSDLQAAGYDDYVQKPFLYSEIYDSIERQMGIRLSNRTETPTAQVNARLLTARHLNIVSKQQLDELTAALKSLDPHQIDHAISQIGVIDSDLALILKHLVEEFDYPAILNTIEEISAMQQQREQL